MRRWALGLALGTAVGAAAAACTRYASQVAPERDQASTVEAPAEVKRAAFAAAPAPQAPAERPAAAAPAPEVAPNVANLKLIRTGYLSLEVAAFGEAAERIAELARAQGGYVAGSRSDAADGDLRSGTFTLRVPADRFDAMFAGVRALGKVASDKVEVQDVTKAYFDLETRLRVKRDTEARLREILRTRTARLADILEAERELARVTEEIESLEGTRRFYDEQVTFATLVVSVQQRPPVVRTGPLQPMREALRDSLRLMAQSAAGLVYLLAFALPWSVVAAIGGLAWRAARRRRPAAPAGA
jgi:hypothetical protein